MKTRNLNFKLSGQRKERRSSQRNTRSLPDLWQSCKAKSRWKTKPSRSWSRARKRQILVKIGSISAQSWKQTTSASRSSAVRKMSSSNSSPTPLASWRRGWPRSAKRPRQLWKTTTSTNTRSWSWIRSCSGSKTRSQGFEVWLTVLRQRTSWMKSKARRTKPYF